MGNYIVQQSRLADGAEPMTEAALGLVHGCKASEKTAAISGGLVLRQSQGGASNREAPLNGIYRKYKKIKNHVFAHGSIQFRAISEIV